MLSGFAEHLWRSHGFALEAGIFGEIYSHQFEGAMTFSRLPLIDDESKWPTFTRIPIALETVRQSLLALRHLLLTSDEGFNFRGPVCLCEPELQSSCGVKDVLERFWQAVTPDPKYEELFERHWQKTACASFRRQ